MRLSSGVLNLQGRARRNALQGTRELRVRRYEHVEVVRALHISAASSIPEQRDGDRPPHRPRPEALNLIDVIDVRGRLWRAVCECGEAPDLFTEEPAAWAWVTNHRCPVLEPFDRPS